MKSTLLFSLLILFASQARASMNYDCMENARTSTRLTIHTIPAEGPANLQVNLITATGNVLFSGQELPQPEDGVYTLVDNQGVPATLTLNITPTPHPHCGRICDWDGSVNTKVSLKYKDHESQFNCF